MNWCPDLLSNFRNMTWLSERCILAPFNESTHAINTALVAQLPGECVEYRSLDSVLEVSGFPSHLLRIIKTCSTNNHITVFRSS